MSEWEGVCFHFLIKPAHLNRSLEHSQNTDLSAATSAVSPVSAGAALALLLESDRGETKPDRAVEIATPIISHVAGSRL